MGSKETEKKSTSNDVRREKHMQRLNSRNPRCKECGEESLAALTGTTPNIICYECQARRKKRSTTEKHHFAGRNNDPLTVSIPSNDHRILSDEQKDWPTTTLRNQDNSPLIRAAATLRGLLDILRSLIERTLGWIPEFLEWLDDLLKERLGAHWWLEYDYPGKTL
jgi:hypothetical protein